MTRDTQAKPNFVFVSVKYTISRTHHYILSINDVEEIKHRLYPCKTLTLGHNWTKTKTFVDTLAAAMMSVLDPSTNVEAPPVDGYPKPRIGLCFAKRSHYGETDFQYLI
jgi:hypothetical protein